MTLIIRCDDGSNANCKVERSVGAQAADQWRFEYVPGRAAFSHFCPVCKPRKDIPRPKLPDGRLM